MGDAAGSGGDSDSSSGDSSSSDEEDVEVDDRDMDRIMKLEASLEVNPNQYDLHLEVRARPPQL